MEMVGISFVRKSVLVVLFIPSVARDGATPVDQGYWVDLALEMFGTVFGGATAYPRAKGIWRDDDSVVAWDKKRDRAKSDRSSGMNTLPFGISPRNE